MTQNEFIKYYSIADAEPVDPSKKAIPAESFSSAIEEFVNQRFPAAVRVKCGNVTAQSILICCEYVAYFFKTLITDIYGRVMLNIEIHSDGKGLYVDIHTDGELPLTDKELRQLIRLARNGGFEFYPEENGIRLSTGFTPTVARRVYALSIADGRRIMVGKMVEIFSCGELLNTDPTPRPEPKPITKKVKNRKSKS